MPDQRPSAARERSLREAIELFFFGYRAFTAGPDAILARRGLGRVHHRVLYFVGREPGISVNALLGVLSVSKQALNGPLRHLLATGLVSAHPSAHDRRIRQLTLTAAGRRLEARLTGIQMDQMAAAFGKAGPGGESGWRSVMKRLIPPAPPR